MVKNPLANAGNTVSIPGLGIGGNGNPLQNSCLESPLDRVAWQAVHVHSPWGCKE